MVSSNGPKVLILNSCTIGFLKNHKDPAHPDEPEITSMDADIDLHLDTASTLHHQEIEMEILSSSLDENFGTLRTSTALHFSSSAQQSVNADTSQARHVLEQVGEVLSCSGETSDKTVFADTVEEEVISNTDEDCCQTKSCEGDPQNYSATPSYLKC
ncbi:uncharacterized protein LOC143023743 [Oratosquilla oratoria]|uniref:uncharacterized protein LOC143023743 n=1 Tax=Oratosquilla oratoria TaxID=337810 RepID=UPI003F763F5D